MKNIFVALTTLFFLISCEKSKQAEESRAESKESEKKFEMYDMSEMSLLMEQMYVDNEKLKERIQSGDTIGAFPNHFMEIHKASMTDDKENDAFFKQKADEFIEAQELIYKDPVNAKEHFNNGVSVCIQCHQVKCGGPIPRIKKLYIK